MTPADGSLTCGTPILRQASRKFSTFRRHLAMVSLGCEPSVPAMVRRGVRTRWQTDTQKRATHHSRRRHVDAGHGSRPHVIGQVAQHDAVGQGRTQVAR